MPVERLDACQEPGESQRPRIGEVATDLRLFRSAIRTCELFLTLCCKTDSGCHVSARPRDAVKVRLARSRTPRAAAVSPAT